MLEVQRTEYVAAGTLCCGLATSFMVARQYEQVIVSGIELVLIGWYWRKMSSLKPEVSQSSWPTKVPVILRADHASSAGADEVIE
jgi:hypothetical protein